ncbi:MAG TPA: VWA domain-containing protein [Edaphobacter sp.]|uniref:VWA domain-containing protein n=1 Tax=Edaphobacter sp. TaxID=1934404 RepID=UPI002CAE16AE|nr:VWA domain-containing protein [Edaphobacter sp.]HUZ97379.1 VWA domain-containing protein [Edaphobacter sp.]
MHLRAAVALLFLPAALVCAQKAPGNAPVNAPIPAAPVTTISAQSTLVLVPTLVKTKKGDLVFTLTANDFTITDNNVDQKVHLEEDTGDQPLALVVAIETGGGGASQFDKYHNLATMIESIVGQVPRRIAVVTFDSEPEILQDFTPNLALMEDAIQNLPPGDSGAAILDAVDYSVDLLRKQPPQYRRAILLIGETVDHGSKVRIEDALRAVSDTNTAIYSLAFSSSRSGISHEASKLNDPNPGPEHGCFSHDPNTDPTVRDDGTKGKPEESKGTQYYDCLAELLPPLRLAKMAAILGMNGLHKNAPETVAKLTGGEYFHFNSQRDLERGLATISNHVPNRYVLSFQPQMPQPGLHAITVTLKDHPDLVVTARSSYWAGDAATAQPQP